MLEKFLRIDREFFNRVLSSMAGTVLAQTVTLGFSIVLARLYSESEFGHFSVFLGLVTITTVLATGTLEKALLFAESNEDLIHLKISILTLAFVVCILISLIGFIFYISEFELLLGVRSVDFLALVPIATFVSVAFQVFLYEKIRSGQIRLIAKSKVVQSLLTGSFQAVFSILQQIHGLIVGHILGLFIFAASIYPERSSSPHSPPVITTVYQTLKRHKNYPKFVMPNELLDAISNQMPLFLIGYFFSISSAGHFALCNRILSAPAALVGQAVSQAFMHKIGKEGLEPLVLRGLIWRIWGALSLIGVLPFSLVFFFGGPIFSELFGEAWRYAGEIAQASSILLFVRFVSSPTSSMYLKLKLQKEQLAFVVAAFLYRSGSIMLALLGYDLIQIIFVASVLEILFILLYNGFALWKLS